MENQDSVAYCGKIAEIKAIPGCDNIEWAKINDWGTILKKGSKQVGDLVGVAITDAVLPQEMVDRLDIKNYLRKGVRVRTIKLKGVYSECLLFDIDNNYKEGQDLMSDFNIVKYEEPVKVLHFATLPRVYFDVYNIHKFKMWRRWFNYQKAKLRKQYSYKDNPHFNVYYKFPNYKNVPHIFTEQDEVVMTRKIHGTNARYGIVKKSKLKFWSKKKYEYIYGSHRVEKGSDSQGFYSTDVWKSVAESISLRDKLELMVSNYKGDIGSGLILYGEIYGPGIQGDSYTYGAKEHQFIAFDIEVNGEFLAHEIFKEKCSSFNIPVVEDLYRGNWSKWKQEELKTALIEDTKVYHEGIVIKSLDGDKRKRAKVISPEYLIGAEKMNVPDYH